VHEQLHFLVSLQDLDTLIRETQDENRRAELEKLGFSMNNIEPLEAARAKLVGKIEPRYLRVYQRLSAKYGRAVVPVENRTCLGCFQTVPPSFFSEITADQPVKVCENCGRILYMLTS
jgi:predicted  nucleic acid-binding Zn-ribbon protein